jgi:putative sterol carrier protein
MKDFLSEEWFASLNETLKQGGSVELPEGISSFSAVFQIEDGPSSAPHAFTITLKPEGGVVSPVDDFMADSVIRISYNDALALYSGEFDSSQALREGRIKIRGNVNVLIPLMEWFQEAFAGQSPA